MDMTRHYRKWLTDERLRVEFNGRYEGEIADVSLERLNNKFRGQQADEPVIRFTDGLLLVPNQRMRRELVEMLGAETDDWCGHHVVIYRQVIEYGDRKTGDTKTRFEKRVERKGARRTGNPIEHDPQFRNVKPRPTRDPDGAELSDYDDSPEALANDTFGTRRRLP